MDTLHVKDGHVNADMLLNVYKRSCQLRNVLKFEFKHVRSGCLWLIPTYRTSIRHSLELRFTNGKKVEAADEHGQRS